MPASEAWRDAPRSLRRVAYRGHFSDYLGGVLFVAGAAQSGMPEREFARLRGCGIPLDDLGPWETPAAEASPPPVEPPPAPDAALAALPSEPAPSDAPGVSVAHPAPPAPSASRDTLPGPGRVSAPQPARNAPRR